eukprot:augustus_masked-scaffold_12-processed-gene-5.4-mRNA-1 protein AED:1.00 eAED:1.00 QI:0/0/0/0/1/1/3/0/975
MLIGSCEESQETFEEALKIYNGRKFSFVLDKRRRNSDSVFFIDEKHQPFFSFIQGLEDAYGIEKANITKELVRKIINKLNKNSECSLKLHSFPNFSNTLNLARILEETLQAHGFGFVHFFSENISSVFKILQEKIKLFTTNIPLKKKHFISVISLINAKKKALRSSRPELLLQMLKNEFILEKRLKKGDSKKENEKKVLKYLIDTLIPATAFQKEELYEKILLYEKHAHLVSSSEFLLLKNYLTVAKSDSLGEIETRLADLGFNLLKISESLKNDSQLASLVDKLPQDKKDIALKREALVKLLVDVSAKVCSKEQIDEDNEGKLHSYTKHQQYLFTELSKALKIVSPRHFYELSDEFAFGAASEIHIGASRGKSSGLTWRAHETRVSCVSWLRRKSLIVSSGEDRRFRIWTLSGSRIFQSILFPCSITFVEPNLVESLLLFGSYNCIYLYSYDGALKDTFEFTQVVRHSKVTESNEVEMLMDGSFRGSHGFGGVCSSGKIFSGNVQNIVKHYDNFSAEKNDLRSLIIRTSMKDGVEEKCLEVRDNVLNFWIGHSKLFLLTEAPQLEIYEIGNLDVSHSIPLETSSESLFVSGCGYFLFQWSLYNYSCKKISDGDIFKNLKVALLTEDKIAFNSNFIAALENRTGKSSLLRYFLFHGNGTYGRKQYQSLPLRENVVMIRAGFNHQFLAMLERNGALYLVSLDASQTGNKMLKLPLTQVSDIIFSENTRMMAAFSIARGKISLCVSPGLGFISNEIYEKAFNEICEIPIAECQQLKFLYFKSASLTISDANSIIKTIPFSPLFHKLERILDDGGKEMWASATNLARMADDKLLWASLLFFSLQKRNTSVAQSCFAGLKAYDKVDFIVSMKEKREPLRSIFLSHGIYGLSKNHVEKELLDQKPPLVYQAVKVHTRSFDFKSARRIAQRFKDETLLRIVDIYEQRYKESHLSEESLDELSKLKAGYSYESGYKAQEEKR